MGSEFVIIVNASKKLNHNRKLGVTSHRWWLIAVGINWNQNGGRPEGRYDRRTNGELAADEHAQSSVRAVPEVSKTHACRGNR